MSKPIALDDAGLNEIEQRLQKGWVIRRDQIEALIAMARERNEFASRAVSPVAPQYISVSGGGGGAGGWAGIFTGQATPLVDTTMWPNICGND
jgi:hypothetical protein